MIIIGIDPSSIKATNKSSYGAATVWEGSELIEEIRFNQTPKQVFDALLKYKTVKTLIGIEKVWAMPWDTPKTSFSLGGGFALITFFSEYISDNVELISPKRWQSYYDLSKNKGEDSKQYKRRIASLAKSMFPQYKVINLTADSYLIANYIQKTYE